MKNILIAVVVVVLVVAGVYTYRHFSKEEPAPPPVNDPIMPSNIEAGEDPDDPPPIPMPPAETDTQPETPPDLAPPPTDLAGTDAYLRQTLDQGQAETRPLLKKFLEQDGLVYKLTTAVDLISRGKNPNSQLQFLQPEQEMVVTRRDQRTYLSTENYVRYEPLVSLVESMDSRRLVRIYRSLRPFVTTAYDQLGNEGQSWADTEAAVLNMIVKAPLPAAEPELVGDGDVYIFADPNLEELSHTKKALIRMGPDNVRRLQNKLSEMKLMLEAP